jgi:hypothetical protein
MKDKEEFIANIIVGFTTIALITLFILAII